MGILQAAIAVQIHIAAFLLPLLGVLINFDPFVYLFRDLGFGNVNNQHIVLLFIRIFLCWLCLAETLRTIALFIIPLLMEHSIFNNLVSTLRHRPTSTYTMYLYMKLLIIQNSGEQMVGYAISVIIGISFFLAVMLTVFLFIGWKYFPLSLYFATYPFIFTVHCTIYFTWPLIVQCHESSEIMIKYEWPLRFLKYCWDVRSRKEIRMRLRATKAITFKSGTLDRKMNRDNKRSFATHIMLRSMDLLLLSEA